MDFLEKYTNEVKDSPPQVEIHNTLLELYLSNDLNFSSITQTNSNGDKILAELECQQLSPMGNFLLIAKIIQPRRKGLPGTASGAMFT
jgi:hypothetical protein